MGIKEIEEILPKEIDADLKILLEKLSLLISDTVSLGTHLMKWDAEKGRAGDESMPPLLFLRNIIELGDAISILIKNSSIDPAKPLLRSLLENTLGLEYMLEKETEKRALSYLVWNTHRKLTFYKKLLSASPSGQQFKKDIQKDKLLKESIDIFDNPNVLAAIRNSENLLKMNKFLPIEAEYQRTKKMLKKSPAWHALFEGPQTIELLSKYLDRHAIYEVFYRSYSGNVHATSVMERKLIRNADGSVAIVQIRYPEDAQSITQSTFNILRIAYLSYCKHRVPEEYVAFQDMYTKLSETSNILLKGNLIRIVN